MPFYKITLSVFVALFFLSSCQQGFLRPLSYYEGYYTGTCQTRGAQLDTAGTDVYSSYSYEYQDTLTIARLTESTLELQRGDFFWTLHNTTGQKSSNILYYGEGVFDTPGHSWHLDKATEELTYLEIRNTDGEPVYEIQCRYQSYVINQ